MPPPQYTHTLLYTYSTQKHSHSLLHIQHKYMHIIKHIQHPDTRYSLLHHPDTSTHMPHAYTHPHTYSRPATPNLLLIPSSTPTGWCCHSMSQTHHLHTSTLTLILPKYRFPCYPKVKHSYENFRKPKWCKVRSIPRFPKVCLTPLCFCEKSHYLTNVGLSRKGNGLMRTFGKWRIPVHANVSHIHPTHQERNTKALSYIYTIQIFSLFLSLSLPALPRIPSLTHTHSHLDFCLNGITWVLSVKIIYNLTPHNATLSWAFDG